MNKRVMCVDDEEVIRSLIVSMMEKLGYQCECVSNADDAIKLFPEFDPFLVFVDLVLDGEMNGAKIADKMHRINPVSVFVALSGKLNLFKIGFLLGSVFTDVLQKPVSYNTLKTVTNYAWEKRQRWEQLLNK